MFEFLIAWKYLKPRKKHISTALISLLSILVITLVVWLVLVFLSVTSGIEKNWLEKLTALHAPLRISPTDAYYRSYYYQIDSIAAASQYSFKTIGEKAQSPTTDPYVAELDMEPSSDWSKLGEIDPVKIAYEELGSLAVPFQDYEIAGALLRLFRDEGTTVSQMSYLLSRPDQNPRFGSLILEEDPKVPLHGFGVLLPKSFRESGVQLHDVGTLSYQAPSMASLQEQKIPIRVQGFYDPGLLSSGNKCVIVPQAITRMIHSAHQTVLPDGTPSNGIFIWPKNWQEADSLQKEISSRFAKRGISSFWKIDTYRDFEFSKDLFLQFQSDRTLFLLISAILLFVACSNVISLLILLVHDKKKEIAILQSMGASSKSIALIFGLCGAFIGTLSCVSGALLAFFTLHHLQTIVSLLSQWQGHAAFNPLFFGSHLPNQMSLEAMKFVLLVTPLLSLFAALIPAWKASRIRPSSVLRGE